jgi:hypothetical protein
MDDRRRRIDEHAANSGAPWAVTALGPVPDDLTRRAAWQQKAAAIGAWRELSGHDHPGDPTGPEPAANNPDLRAAWHAARAALTTAHTRKFRAAERRAQAGAAHRHGERDEARRQTEQAQGSGQESWLPDLGEASRRIEELAARHRELTATIVERNSAPGPVEVPEPGTDPTFPLDPAHLGTAILQPPRPEIPPSPWALERLSGRNLDHEAAD